MKGMEKRVFNKALRILHVDDDAVEAMNLKRVFAKMEVKHQLEVAQNGEVAMSRLKSEHGQRPHVILLDLHMPLMDGIEFLKELRADEALQSIPVYVLTSSDLAQDRESARRLGISRYLVKPFTPEKYNEVILELLLHWESLDLDLQLNF